jgi:hypothetical protein
MQEEKQEILRIIPANLKQLRACMACSMIKVSLTVIRITYHIILVKFFLLFLYLYTYSTILPHITYKLQATDQFEKDGCENCDDFLHMKGNRDAVYDCTSTNFDG